MVTSFETNWDYLKLRVNLLKNYMESSNRYMVFTLSEPVMFFCYLEKGSDDAIEFEEEYKPYLMEPSYFEDAYPEVLEYTNADVLDGDLTSWDYKIENKSRFLFGGYVKVDSNAVFGDYLEFSLIDKDNILGYGAGAVLSKYINKQWIWADKEIKLKMDLSQIKFVLQGLYLRITLYSESQTRPKLLAGYYFYEY